MQSEQRKRIIQSMLRRGDLKSIANKLEMSYSYLSQVFSPASKFTFTDELARKVENAMEWKENVLDVDTTTSQQPHKSALQALALRGRAASMGVFLPNKKVNINQKLVEANIEKRADIVVYNNDGSVYLIGEQSVNYEDAHTSDQLIMMMAITGAEYGVVFSADSGVGDITNDYKFTMEEKRSRWFQSTQGKVEQVPAGPKGIFEAVGI